MAGDLYWEDTLAWSERQAALLRRVAAGERVNDVDWAHVIEEIEDVGKSPVCPFTLDELVTKRPDLDALLGKLAAGAEP